jgi:hypothetical protein
MVALTQAEQTQPRYNLARTPRPWRSVDVLLTFRSSQTDSLPPSPTSALARFHLAAELYPELDEFTEVRSRRQNLQSDVDFEPFASDLDRSAGQPLGSDGIVVARSTRKIAWQRSTI